MGAAVHHRDCKSSLVFCVRASDEKMGPAHLLRVQPKPYRESVTLATWPELHTYVFTELTLISR